MTPAGAVVIQNPRWQRHNNIKHSCEIWSQVSCCCFVAAKVVFNWKMYPSSYSIGVQMDVFSIFFGSWVQQAKQMSSSSAFGESQGVPGPERALSLQLVQSVALGLFPVGNAWNTFVGRLPQGILNCLVCLFAAQQEQRFNPKEPPGVPPDVWAPRPVPEGEPQTRHGGNIWWLFSECEHASSGKVRASLFRLSISVSYLNIKLTVY